MEAAVWAPTSVPLSKPLPLAAVTDGLSNTVILSERLASLADLGNGIDLTSPAEARANPLRSRWHVDEPLPFQTTPVQTLLDACNAPSAVPHNGRSHAAMWRWDPQYTFDHAAPPEPPTVSSWTTGHVPGSV